ncbi:MAG TPA: MoaD/ThiS family protein [Bacillota bacterium]|jgi:molybdopterin converting factor small subunit|nr:MoaD/ThiS family protein [Bacillota bacterium]HOK70423.1 MoaD/ThiS family protein [Bacillota bacterium]HOL52128.1 MoaD/ThiS family protein [Bacillota bacterium]HPQ01691.1 MoaD/ThiS family protein [Bacillota bacterium]HPZ14248.1 MoaD/ThiS family protein [Bacillota bacterium]
MIEVRIYGPLRERLGTGSLEVEASRAGSVGELLAVVSEVTGAASLSELRKASVFVNGTNIVDLRLFRTALLPGDEVVLLSPSGGG